MQRILGIALLLAPLTSTVSAEVRFLEDDRNASSRVFCVEPGSGQNFTYRYDIGFPINRFQDDFETFVQDDQHAGFDWLVSTTLDTTFTPNGLTADGGILIDITGESNNCLSVLRYEAESQYAILLELEEPHYVTLHAELTSHPERGFASISAGSPFFSIFENVNNGETFDVTLEGLLPPGLYSFTATAQGSGSSRLDNGEDDARVYEAGFSLDVQLEGDVCPGDANRDRHVDFTDILDVLRFWGECRPCPADFDLNGSADFSDILIVLGNWGPCG